MCGKAPKCFLTDQDAAMRKALGNVMVGTCHRWCLCHILAKFSKKLGMYKLYKELKVDLHDATYDSVSEEEFDLKWCDAIAIHGSKVRILLH